MTVDADNCGYICYSFCTCDESDYAGEICPFKNIDDCPVHTEDG